MRERELLSAHVERTASKHVRRADGCTCVRDNGGFILIYDPFCDAPPSQRHRGKASKRKKRGFWGRRA